jgi:hypothetical protein
MSSRRMSLLPRATLHSDVANNNGKNQFLYQKLNKGLFWEVWFEKFKYLVDETPPPQEKK